MYPFSERSTSGFTVSCVIAEVGDGNAKGGLSVPSQFHITSRQVGMYIPTHSYHVRTCPPSSFFFPPTSLGEEDRISIDTVDIKRLGPEQDGERFICEQRHVKECHATAYLPRYCTVGTAVSSYP
jgi:hypothetical protein